MGRSVEERVLRGRSKGEGCKLALDLAINVNVYPMTVIPRISGHGVLCSDFLAAALLGLDADISRGDRGGDLWAIHFAGMVVAGWMLVWSRDLDFVGGLCHRWV